MEFGEACELLEKKYGLSVWKWTPKTKTEEEVIEDTSEQDFEGMRQRVERLLYMIKDEKPMVEIMAFWEGFDCVLWHLEKELWDYQRAFAGLKKIHTSLIGRKDQ